MQAIRFALGRRRELEVTPGLPNSQPQNQQAWNKKDDAMERDFRTTRFVGWNIESKPQSKHGATLQLALCAVNECANKGSVCLSGQVCRFLQERVEPIRCWFGSRVSRIATCPRQS